ncbi:hypothetical protein KJ059_18830 [Myxococcota bacterium]|nr:hypothetical protein [Myxococcota bacterium]MCZ7617081.1 hypothetical protein [Myxococcota bacterium]
MNQGSIARSRVTHCHAHRVLAGALGVAVLFVFALGCAGRQIQTPVYDQQGVRVFLRQQMKGGEPVDRGFSHPVTIAPVRVTNILARIQVREDDAEDKTGREAALPTGLLYSIGQGIAEALGKADASQEVVVMAVERRKSLRVFTNDHLTSLIVWMKDDRLFVHLGELGQVMSRNPSDKPREPQLTTIESKKKVLGGDGFTPVGSRLVAADWRAAVFSDISAIRIRPGGEIVRRTILLEETPEEDAANRPGPAPPPEGLSPDALRALADLEEARRRGELSETDYQTQRRDILLGKLPAP